MRGEQVANWLLMGFEYGGAAAGAVLAPKIAVNPFAELSVFERRRGPWSQFDRSRQVWIAASVFEFSFWCMQRVQP